MIGMPKVPEAMLGDVVVEVYPWLDPIRLVAYSVEKVAAVAVLANENSDPLEVAAARAVMLAGRDGRVEGEPLDEMFSDAEYPLFGHIRHFARARQVNPVAVWAVVMARIGATVSPRVVLPALVGSYGSLNSFICLVGASGMGKGGSTGAARDAVDITMAHTAGLEHQFNGPVYSVKIGSGQGVAAQYCWRERPEKSTGAPGALHRERDSVVFTCYEVADLVAKSSGTSTLLATLCEMWMAEELGSSYVDPTKRLPVAEHSYRAMFILHAQPDLMGPLLIDAASGGTPQRFIYVPVEDRHMPEERPDEPAPWPWRAPIFNAGRHVMEICPDARKAITEHHALKMKGLADPLDGHLLFCREKLAALIAISAGRNYMNCKDWQYAGQVMELSVWAREGALAGLRVVRTKAAVAVGKMEAIKEEAKEDSKVERALVRIREIIDKAKPYELTKRQIQQRASKKWDGEAFDMLCNSGAVIWEIRSVPNHPEVTYYALGEEQHDNPYTV